MYEVNDGKVLIIDPDVTEKVVDILKFMTDISIKYGFDFVDTNVSMYQE